MEWRSDSACFAGWKSSMLRIGTAYSIAVYSAAGMNSMGGRSAETPGGVIARFVLAFNAAEHTELFYIPAYHSYPWSSQ